mgnify:CR=1 FL=1
MVTHIELGKSVELLYEFIEIVLKTISLTVSRKTYKTIDSFDLTLSI